MEECSWPLPQAAFLWRWLGLVAEEYFSVQCLDDAWVLPFQVWPVMGWP